MFKRTILALSVAALTLSTISIYAQASATLVMKSGERVTGQLIDLGGVGFTIKVNDQTRQVPTNDVAAVDFTGGSMTAADWARLTDGKQVVVLKNGQTVNGQLFDISGTSPLKITLKTDSGDRDFSSNEIGQILLARPDSPVATTGSQITPATGSGIVVSSKQSWTATGITVRRGDTVTFNTTGEVQLSTDVNDIASPAGSKAARYAAGSPLPGALAGALIGRLGPNGTPFAIGNQTSVQMPAAGQLFVGINDDHLNDNQGEFRVEIRNTTGSRR